MSRNQIVFGPQHITSLRNIFSNKDSKLQHLNLSKNNFSDEVRTLSKIAPSLVNKTDLLKLNLESCKITIRGFGLICSNLSANS